MRVSLGRRRALQLGSVLAVGSVAGCPFGESEAGPERRVAADWRPDRGEWLSATRYDPSGNRHNPHAEPPRTEPSLAWETTFEQTNPIPWFSFANGRLFLRTESALTAYDTGGGEELWREPQPTIGTVQYIDGRLYNGANGEAQAMTLDGKELWRIDASRYVIGEMEGHVYAGTEDGLAWYDADSGERLGLRETTGRPSGVVDGTIYGFTSDAVYAYEHGDTEPSRTWRQPLESPYEIQGNWFVVADGTLHVRERGGPGEKRIGRYAVADGAVETTERTYDGVHDIVVRDGVEYVVTHEQEGEDVTWTLTARDDEVLWEESFGTSVTSLVVADDVLYVDGEDGELLALDADTGERLWERADSGGMLAIVDDTIYVFRGTRLLALR